MSTQAFLFFVLGVIFVATSASTRENPNACALLTRTEVEQVQGDPVVEVKSSAPERKRFAVSQCFYTAKTFHKSVSLEVTRPAQQSKVKPREEWRRLFRSSKNGVKPAKMTPQSKKEQIAQPPQPIKGIGDEAFWVGDQVMGVLYVLKKNSYFRISVGGWPESSVRLQKTAELAKKVAPRL
jgi:hypothetical protein